MTKMVTVEVSKDPIYVITRKLKDVMSYLQTKTKLIPEEYRDSAEIDFTKEEIQSMNPKIITTQVASSTFPSKLIEAVDWLKAKLESIPAEYRESATIQIEAYNDYYYDKVGCSITIQYSRPADES